MKKFFLFVLAINLLTTNDLLAQNCTLRGSITEKETNEPIIGANIIVQEGIGTATDIDGKYIIKVEPGTYRVKAHMIGYEDQVISITLENGETKVLNFNLAEEDKVLDVVVVTASQFEKNISQETVSMDVIGKDLIKNVNPAQAGEIIGKTPGVQVQDGQINIRGGSSYSYGVGSRTAVLLDGLSLTGGDLGDALLKFAPLEMVDQIEVMKGASSVVYGSSALNGVINMRTGWAKNTPETEITLSGTMHGKYKRDTLNLPGLVPNEQQIGILHRQKFGQLNLVTSANFYRLKSFLQTNDEVRGRVTLKTKYIPKKHPGLSMGIDFATMYEKSDRFFLSKDVDQRQTTFFAGSGDRYLRTAVDPHIVYLAPRNNRIHFLARALNVYRFGNAGDEDVNSWLYMVDLQHQKTFSIGQEAKFTLTSGIPVTVSTNVSNLWEDRGMLVTASGAVYLQGEFNYRRWSVSGGGRYEIQQVVDALEYSKPVFRAGINFKAAKYTYLRGSFGQGYRMPSLAERYATGDLSGTAFVIPKKDLKPEKSWNTELGVKQGFQITKKWKGLFDFSTFLMRYKNMIEYNFGYYPNLDENGNPLYPGRPSMLIGFKPDNLDQTQVYGYEASVMGDGKIGKIGFRTLIGYTYNFPVNLGSGSKYQNFGVFMGDAFKYMFTHLTEDQITYTDTTTGIVASNILFYRSRHLLRADVEAEYKKFTLGLAANYTSGPEYYPASLTLVFSVIDGGAGSINEFKKRHEKGDWVFDIRAGYQFTDFFKLSFLVKNFTNHEYAYRIGKLDAPINYTLQAKFNF